MTAEWTAARNHYLAMAALAMALGTVVALVDPGIGSAVAVPLVFFAAQTAGAKFAGLAARHMTGAEALRLAGIAAALQVGLGLVALIVSLLAERQQITTIHYGTILILGAATAVISLLVTLAGLRFGTFVDLRRQASGPRRD
jgi:hypothetical protein